MDEYRQKLEMRLGPAHQAFAVPTSKEWIAVERTFSRVMPRDFKTLVGMTGDGYFRNCFRLFNPSKKVCLFERAMIDGIIVPLRKAQEWWSRPPEFSLWPDEGGAFPVAETYSGEAVLHSYTQQGEDCWIYVDGMATDWQAYSMSSFEFFVKLFDGELEGLGRTFFENRRANWETLPFFTGVNRGLDHGLNS